MRVCGRSHEGGWEATHSALLGCSGARIERRRGHARRRSSGGIPSSHSSRIAGADGRRTLESSPTLPRSTALPTLTRSTALLTLTRSTALLRSLATTPRRASAAVPLTSPPLHAALLAGSRHWWLPPDTAWPLPAWPLPAWPLPAWPLPAWPLPASAIASARALVTAIGASAKAAAARFEGRCSGDARPSAIGRCSVDGVTRGCLRGSPRASASEALLAA